MGLGGAAAVPPRRPGPGRRTPLAGELRPGRGSLRACAHGARRAVPAPPRADPRTAGGHGGLVPPAARRAHRVITVSEASRDDIVRLLGIPAQRVEAVPNGWTPPRSPGDPGLARESSRWVSGRGASGCVRPAAQEPRLLLDALLGFEPAERPVLVLAGHGTDTGACPRARAAGLRTATALSGGSTRHARAALRGRHARRHGDAGGGLRPAGVEALGRGMPVASSDLPVCARSRAAWRLVHPGDPGPRRARFDAASGRAPMLIACAPGA